MLDGRGIDEFLISGASWRKNLLRLKGIEAARYCMIE
jgi:hypothetical protein